MFLDRVGLRDDGQMNVTRRPVLYIHNREELLRTAAVGNAQTFAEHVSAATGDLARKEGLAHYNGVHHQLHEGHTFVDHGGDRLEPVPINHFNAARTTADGDGGGVHGTMHARTLASGDAEHRVGIAAVLADTVTTATFVRLVNAVGKEGCGLGVTTANGQAGYDTIVLLVTWHDEASSTASRETIKTCVDRAKRDHQSATARTPEIVVYYVRVLLKRQFDGGKVPTATLFERKVWNLAADEAGAGGGGAAAGAAGVFVSRRHRRWLQGASFRVPSGV